MRWLSRSGGNGAAFTVSGPICCVLRQAATSADLCAVAAQEELRAKWGFCFLKEVLAALDTSIKNGVPFIISEEFVRAICKRLTQAAASNVGILNSESCVHTIKDHISALMELDEHFERILGRERAVSAAKSILKLTNNDLKFLRSMRIAA